VTKKEVDEDSLRSKFGGRPWLDENEVSSPPFTLISAFFNDRFFFKIYMN